MNDVSNEKIIHDVPEVELLEEKPPLFIHSDSDDEERRMARRKRRRKLRRMIRQAQGLPSFLGLITANYDETDEEEDGDDGDQDEQNNIAMTAVKVESSEVRTVVVTPKRIRVDVDAHLGLKGTDAIPIKAEDIESPIQVNNWPTEEVRTPLEEGWYEGTLSPLAMQDDASYLNPLQVWIRNHLEFFSATAEDVGIVQAGRKPVQLGRVGVRCIPCALARRIPPPMERFGHEIKTDDSHGRGDAVLPDATPSETVFSTTYAIPPQPPTSTKVWAVGAVSYPANVAAIYTCCSQKPTLHWERHCPFLSMQERAELQQLLQQPDTRRSRGGLSAASYYTIACRRIGLVDIGEGIRFGRDLTLDPLPFEKIRHQVMIGEETLAINERISADEENERILAECVAEDDSNLLCKTSDKSMLTDYMFLTLRQMLVCHAMPMDMTSRGKKTRTMRVGLAGFCCRHCSHTSDAGSCKSFTSAPDNLVSAISNAFAIHLQKCRHTPLSIKKAIQVYKRLHNRQMNQLPYGSQKTVIHQIWERLRTADKSEEEISDLTPVVPLIPMPHPSTPHDINFPVTPSISGPSTRPENFPVCHDPEVTSVIAHYETKWDLAINDGLITPEDRNLVSDFVFLTMRQLRAIHPPNFEPNKKVKHGIMGLSCIHCHGKDLNYQASPSGRSYPSAPDNYASALNTGFYNHMQNCTFVPDNLKRALSATRKIHSSQCSSLKFGSQRKYFNILFARLHQLKSSIPEDESATANAPINYNTHAQSVHEQPPMNLDVISPQNCHEHGFVCLECYDPPVIMCLRCRLVPLQFRAKGAIQQTVRARLDELNEHIDNCKGDRFDLTVMTVCLREMIDDCFHGDRDVLATPTFRELISLALGHDPVWTKDFIDDLIAGLDETSLVADTRQVWCRPFPNRMNSNDLENFFDKNLTQYTTGRRFRDCPKLLSFLQLISPNLELSEQSYTDLDDNQGSDPSSLK